MVSNSHAEFQQIWEMVEQGEDWLAWVPYEALWRKSWHGGTQNRSTAVRVHCDILFQV